MTTRLHSETGHTANPVAEAATKQTEAAIQKSLIYCNQSFPALQRTKTNCKFGCHSGILLLCKFPNTKENSLRKENHRAYTLTHTRVSLPLEGTQTKRSLKVGGEGLLNLREHPRVLSRSKGDSLTATPCCSKEGRCHLGSLSGLLYTLAGSGGHVQWSEIEGQLRSPAPRHQTALGQPPDLYRVLLQAPLFVPASPHSVCTCHKPKLSWVSTTLLKLNNFSICIIKERALFFFWKKNINQFCLYPFNKTIPK